MGMEILFLLMGAVIADWLKWLIPDFGVRIGFAFVFALVATIIWEGKGLVNFGKLYRRIGG